MPEKYSPRLRDAHHHDCEDCGTRYECYFGECVEDQGQRFGLCSVCEQAAAAARRQMRRQVK